MTEPFRPSNATQADSFRADFCERCVHERHSITRCQIAMNAMVYQIGDDCYPKEWIAYDDGSAECTAFEAIQEGGNAMNWRPISEAPKDESQVVWYEGNWYEATHFDGDAWITVCDHIIAPTLYLPITPPGEQQANVNQRLLDACQSAMRIENLWVINEPTNENEDEARALFIMRNKFLVAIEAAKQAKQ